MKGYNPNRPNYSPSYFLKVWRAEDDFDKFECGRHLKVRSSGPGTMTVTDVGNNIVVDMPRDGLRVFHEDEHGTTVDTFEPLTPTVRERRALNRRAKREDGKGPFRHLDLRE